MRHSQQERIAHFTQTPRTELKSASKVFHADLLLAIGLFECMLQHEEDQLIRRFNAPVEIVPAALGSKAWQNLMGGYPPQGRVRVAAPLAIDDEAVRLAVVGKLGWIKRQRAKFQAQL